MNKLNKIRNLITLYMVGTASILILLLIISLITSSFVKNKYEKLLGDSIAKYTLASSMETTATGMKYRAALGYETGFEQLKLLMQIREYRDIYKESKTNDVIVIDELLTDIETNGIDMTNIINAIQDTKDIVNKSIHTNQEKLNNRVNGIIVFSVIFAIIVIIAVGVICFRLPRRLAVPIIKLAECAKRISTGEFKGLEFPDSSILEIKELNASFTNVASAIDNIISSVDEVCVEYINGNDRKIELEGSNLQGEFRSLAEKVNELLDNTVIDIKEILNCIDAYANGNFDYYVKKFAGEHAQINIKLDGCRDNLLNVVSNINLLTDAVKKGDLDLRLRTEGVTGDWLNVVDGLNNLVEAVSEPIAVTIEGLNQVAAANLSYRIENKYEGAYKNICDSINTLSSTLQSYIGDISDVLKGLAHHDLTVKNSISYDGDFKEIEISIDTVTENLRSLVSNMVGASEQIDAGAKSMAESSTSLALGATKQADAIRVLTEVSRTVDEKANENFDAASSAKEYSDAVNADIQNGNKLLAELNIAMKNIANASNSIQNINAVIDDIAFQTNILALNAAVEAARAGQHGKGFAVVADEVRNLAGKSQESAKDAGDLIKETLSKVDVGVKVVDNTISLLTNILKQISNIDAVIENVLNISSEQKGLSEQMKSETDVINEAVNDISATSEETAAASQELASQIITFNESINLFKV